MIPSPLATRADLSSITWVGTFHEVGNMMALYLIICTKSSGGSSSVGNCCVEGTIPSYGINYGIV